MRRFLATATVVGCVLAGAVACGDDSDNPGSSGTDAEPKVIKVRFKDGEVTPNGDRIDVAVGQEVEFIVAADEPGEIHVHSEPEEHELVYEEGEEEFPPLVFDQAGVIEVESHNLEQVIVQLEVR